MNINYILELLESKDFISLFFLIMSVYCNISIYCFFLSLLSPGTRKLYLAQGIFVSRLETVVQEFFNFHDEFMKSLMN